MPLTGECVYTLLLLKLESSFLSLPVWTEDSNSWGNHTPRTKCALPRLLRLPSKKTAMFGSLAHYYSSQHNKSCLIDDLLYQFFFSNEYGSYKKDFKLFIDSVLTHVQEWMQRWCDRGILRNSKTHLLKMLMDHTL